MGVEKWMEHSRFGKNTSKASEVGHKPAILNDSKKIVGIGERRNIKLASGVES